MTNTRKKHPFFKIVVLKEMPHRTSIYPSLPINDDLCHKVTIQDRIKTNTTNQTSIAYLSSIIQDERSMSDDRYLESRQSVQYNSCNETPLFLSQPKEEGSSFSAYKQRVTKIDKRHLSVIIENDKQSHQKDQRSKTQSIDKLIAKRKIRPIDQLKIGSKNIHFSLKNRRQLTHDFCEFVSHNQPFDQKQNDLQQPCLKTMLFEKKKNYQNFKKLRNQSGFKKIRNSTDRYSNLASSSFSEVKSRPFKKEQQNFSGFVKRAKNGMRVTMNFEWASVEKETFNLQNK